MALKYIFRIFAFNSYSYIGYFPNDRSVNRKMGDSRRSGAAPLWRHSSYAWRLTHIDAHLTGGHAHI